MPRKIRTASDRARDLRARHPDMPIAEIAKRTGITRNGVISALASKPGRGASGGRPRKDAGTVACEVCGGTGRVVP